MILEEETGSVRRRVRMLSIEGGGIHGEGACTPLGGCQGYHFFVEHLAVLANGVLPVRGEDGRLCGGAAGSLYRSPWGRATFLV